MRIRKLAVVMMVVCMMVSVIGALPAQAAGSDSEASLRSLLAGKAGTSQFQYFYYGDYDGNGTKEAFAFVMYGNYDGWMRGDIWFVNASGAAKLRSGKEYISFEKLGNSAPMILSAEEGAGGSGSTAHNWIVNGTNAKELTTPIYGAFEKGTGNVFYAYPSYFDACTDGTGHTWKRYYYYLSGTTLKEYGGIQISLDNLLEFKGAAEIVQKVKNNGYTIKEIYYRACNIINVNLRKGNINDNLTLQYNDSSVWDLNQDYGGSYLAANTPSYATYPAKFVHPSGTAASVKPSKVVLSSSGTVTLDVGSTLQLKATLQPSNAQSTLKWSSSKTKYATVSESGLVTAKAEGTATITVKTGNNKKATVKVKVVDPYKPTKIKLNQSGTVTINRGSMLQLGATLEPSTAKSTLTWKSSKTKYATVNANGTVTANAEGTATITVKTHNGKKATVKVKVVDPYKPTKVKLNQSGTVTVNRGSTLQLGATLEPSTAQSTLTWKSSKTKYATVSGNGTVTAKAEGTTTITVKTHNGKKATVKVKVVDPYKPLKITLGQKGTITLNRGSTLHLSTALEPTTAQSELKWSSSKTKYATVDGNGNVTGKAEGTTTITVKTYNGKKATVKVKVVDPYKPTGVTLNQSGTASLETGKTLQLSATLSPSTAKSDLTWKSSNTKVAKVDANGLVTAVGKGTATITVTTYNKKKNSIKVSVKSQASIPGGMVSNDLAVVLDRMTDDRFRGKQLAQMIGGMRYMTSGEYSSYYYINNFAVIEEDACYVILTNPSPYQMFGMYVGMDVSQAKAIFRSHGWNYDDDSEMKLLRGEQQEDEPWGFLYISYNSKGKVTNVDCSFD